MTKQEINLKNQIQDTGAKMIHLAPYTKSNIVSKSIAEGVVTTGKYVVTVKDLANGCTSTASVELTSNTTSPAMEEIIAVTNFGEQSKNYTTSELT